MQIPEKIFKSYDIRGIYPTEVNEEIFPQVVTAIYAFFTKDFLEDKQFQIVVGRDMRTSSPELFDLAKQTLVDLGAEVIDVGLVSTPTFYFSVFHYGYDAGIMITASHNPKEYNGIKIVKNTPNGLLKIGKSTGMEDIKTLALAQIKQDPKDGGKVTQIQNALQDEAENALKIVGNPQINPFKVVADPANAMGGLYVEEIFKHIPGELIKMNFELDGTFPVHQPDPMQAKNLVDLQTKIKEVGADVGLAPDGDGDRMFVVDEKGDVVTPSVITTIIALELLKSNPGASFVVDVKYNLNARKSIEEAGGKVVISKTGHAFITETLQKTGSIFGGEASAHYYFKANGGAESQMPVILFLLEVMTRENKPLSEIADMYRKAYESGEINFEVENAPEIIQAVQEKYADGEVSNLDGVAIDFADKRVSLRSSNTEPLLRLNVEAFDQSVMEQTRDEVLKLIEEKAVKPEVSSVHH
jgi:phosphomannomutase